MNSFRTRVLLIDDSPSSLVWQLVPLQEENYDTLTSNCTAEGVRIARMERPDLVILDATSRYDEVLAAAAELRADQSTRAIPVLLVLGNGRKRSSEELTRVSDDCVTKPLDREEYIGKIRALLGRHRRGSGPR